MILADYTFTVVNALSFLTIIGQILALVLLIILLKETFGEPKERRWRGTHLLLFMFIVALTATSGSLFFSEIAGWTPCKLCWFQRILMYPQALLLLIAVWRRDMKIAPYILALCLVGIVFSTGHYWEQVQAALHPVPAGTSLKPCDASGVSCASTQITFAYGYITIPMMALTAFVMNALGSVLLLKKTASS
jgi:disulfide bond formation protein DsbB